jgi:hypothetical protein
LAETPGISSQHKTLVEISSDHYRHSYVQISTEAKKPQVTLKGME